MVLTARRKVEVSLRTVTSGDAVPLTTHHARFGKSAALGSRGGPTLVFVASDGPRSRHAQLGDGQKRRCKSDHFAAHTAPHRSQDPSSIIVRAPRRSAALRGIFLAQPPSMSIDLAAPCRQPSDRRTRQTTSPAAPRRYPLPRRPRSFDFDISSGAPRDRR